MATFEDIKNELPFSVGEAVAKTGEKRETRILLVMVLSPTDGTLLERTGKLSRKSKFQKLYEPLHEDDSYEGYQVIENVKFKNDGDPLNDVGDYIVVIDDAFEYLKSLPSELLSNLIVGMRMLSGDGNLQIIRSGTIGGIEFEDTMNFEDGIEVYSKLLPEVKKMVRLQNEQNKRVRATNANTVEAPQAPQAPQAEGTNVSTGNQGSTTTIPPIEGENNSPESKDSIDGQTGLIPKVESSAEAPNIKPTQGSVENNTELNNLKSTESTNTVDDDKVVSKMVEQMVGELKLIEYQPLDVEKSSENNGDITQLVLSVNNTLQNQVKVYNERLVTLTKDFKSKLSIRVQEELFKRKEFIRTSTDPKEVNGFSQALADLNDEYTETVNNIDDVVREQAEIMREDYEQRKHEWISEQVALLGEKYDREHLPSLENEQKQYRKDQLKILADSYEAGQKDLIKQAGERYEAGMANLFEVVRTTVMDSNFKLAMTGFNKQYSELFKEINNEIQIDRAKLIQDIQNIYQAESNVNKRMEAALVEADLNSAHLKAQKGKDLEKAIAERDDALAKLANTERELQNYKSEVDSVTYLNNKLAADRKQLIDEKTNPLAYITKDMKEEEIKKIFKNIIDDKNNEKTNPSKFLKVSMVITAMLISVGGGFAADHYLLPAKNVTGSQKNTSDDKKSSSVVLNSSSKKSSSSTQSSTSMTDNSSSNDGTAISSSTKTYSPARSVAVGDSILVTIGNQNQYGIVKAVNTDGSLLVNVNGQNMTVN